MSIKLLYPPQRQASTTREAIKEKERLMELLYPPQRQASTTNVALH